MADIRTTVADEGIEFEDDPVLKQLLIRVRRDTVAYIDELLSDNVAKGDALMMVKRNSAGAIGQSLHDYNETNRVKLTQFYVSPGVRAAPGAQDNTVAMQFAEACLAAMGGGVLEIPFPGEWRMNHVVTHSNIHIEGPGGLSEYDVNCIRPFNMALPAITWGDGVTDVRYCSVSRCHFSGTDKSPGSVRTSAGNAPYTLLLKGGVVDWHMDLCVLYNGIVNLGAVPTEDGASITGVTITRSHARSDLAGVASARNFYLARYEHNVDSPDLGYLTSFKFDKVRVNGPKNTDNAGNPTSAAPTGAGQFGGYVLEAAQLGNVGITVEINNSYWDCSDGCGVFLTGSSGCVGFNAQLDPGGIGRVVLKTDQTSLNVSRYWVGHMRHGGQKFQNGSGTQVTMPSEADTFMFKPLITQPFFIGPIYLTNSLNPYNEGSVLPFLDMDSANGPFTLNLADFSVKTPGRGLRVAEGADAKQGVATLVGGSVVVSNASVTANSRIMLTPQAPGGTPGWVRVSARTPGTSFTITSSSGTDTSVVAYQIFEPA